MASTWSNDINTVFGNYRVLIGTFTATDGGDQGVIQTGLKDIKFAMANAQGDTATYTAGGIDLVSAASGGAYTVLVVGN